MWHACARHGSAGILNINIDGWTNDITGSCPVNGANITTNTITASGPGLEVMMPHLPARPSFLRLSSPPPVCRVRRE